jgi:hypothetical protein
MSTRNLRDREAAFLAQFAEITDESFLSEAAKKYIALHRSGSFQKSKIGRKADGSIYLYYFDPVHGPLIAAITLPTDKKARKLIEDDQKRFIDRARAKK